jgi:DNA repair exonuclease SbcCD ATPase subunit
MKKTTCPLKPKKAKIAKRDKIAIKACGPDKQESNIKKGILFFESTFKKCPSLFEQAEATVEELNQLWIQTTNSLTPITYGTQKSQKSSEQDLENLEGLEELEQELEELEQELEQELFLTKWLASTIQDHHDKLKNIISGELDKITTLPTLIQGFIQKVGKDTQQISYLLDRIEENIKRKEQDTQLCQNLKEEIAKKESLANFFEEEVKERSKEFSEGLSKYITHYSVISHLIDCSQYLLTHNGTTQEIAQTDHPKNKRNIPKTLTKTLTRTLTRTLPVPMPRKICLSNLEKKIKSIKNPLL